MAYAGLKSLTRHRAGQRLTQRQAILAKCGDFMGGYADGRQPTQKSYSGNVAAATEIPRSATATIHSAKAVQCVAGPEPGAKP